MKRLLWIFSFFAAVPVAMYLSFTLLRSSYHRQTLLSLTPKVLSASAQNSDFPVSDHGIIFSPPGYSDARPLLIRKYLQKYSSPLEPYSHLIVYYSDKYSLDYRLLVAIAQQESNLCKKIPADSHNCWGYGIYGDQVVMFDSYPQALETVARGLKTNYLDKGLDTPEKIMAKYTPPSVEIGGPWAIAVSSFLTDLE